MNSQISQLSAESFDPAAEVFIAQAQRPGGLAAVSLRDLTPFQRALMVIDGTVTRFIEAYQQEPVNIFRLAQTEARTVAADRWLQVPAEENVIRRQVLLRGASTGRCFAWADSCLAASRLTAGMRAGLETDPGGLGRILLDSVIETRRECLWFGREQLSDIPEVVADGLGHDFLTRTYRVITNESPLMLITERFAFQQRPMATI